MTVKRLAVRCIGCPCRATFVLDALADHLRRFPTEPGDVLLRCPDGRPVDSDRFGHQWRRACRTAGVAGLGFHALRHTFASTLLSRGSR
jgi:integrase